MTKTEVPWIFPAYKGTDCWQDYQAGTIMGKGGFGTTYKAYKKDTREEVAVKASASMHLQG
jgi:calcium-dependent protein kinase